MRRLFLLTTVAVIFNAVLAAADLAGTWKGSMETQAGVTSIVITIQPGSALAGKVQAGEYEGPIEKAKVDGEKLAFAANMGMAQLSFAGTVAGDEMKLDVVGTQGDKYKLVCKRLASK